MALRVARIYDDTPGHRILIDRLWPRGVAKASAPWDEWRKDLAPSDALRQAYHSGGLGAEAFAKAYRAELDARTDGPALPQGDVTLVTAAKDAEHGHAAVLRDWIKQRR